MIKTEGWQIRSNETKANVQSKRLSRNYRLRNQL